MSWPLGEPVDNALVWHCKGTPIGEREPSETIGGNVKGGNHDEEQYGDVLESYTVDVP